MTAGRGPLPELALFLAAIAFGLAGYGLPRASGPAFEPGPPDPEGLRVVTWNVGGAADGVLHGLAEQHEAAVVGTLRALDADLVFLQELNDEQLARIARAVDPEAQTAWNGARVGVYASRARAFTLLGVEEGRERAPLAVLYEKRECAAVVHAVGVHAHPWSARRRNRDLGRAVDLLDPPTHSRLRILCGDLNLDLFRRGRNDLFTDDEHLDVETYNYVASRLVDAGLGAGPTAEPDRRLDYVFASESLKVVAAGPWREQRVGDMDHHPLVVDFELPDER